MPRAQYRLAEHLAVGHDVPREQGLADAKQAGPGGLDRSRHEMQEHAVKPAQFGVRVGERAVSTAASFSPASPR